MLTLALSFLLAIPLTPERPIAPPQRGPVTPMSYESAVASNGDTYLASWFTDTTTHLSMVDDGGNVLLEREMPRRLEALTAIGHDYLGVTSTFDTRYLVVIDGSTLAVRAGDMTPFPAVSFPPSLASNGVTALLVSDDGSARLLDANGRTLAGPITYGPAYHPVAAGAFPNGSYVVVSSTDDTSIALATFIQADGTLVRTPTPLKTQESVYVSIGQGGVASDGTNVLAAWRNGTHVYFAVLSRDGAIVSGPTPIPSGDFGNPPRVVWNGRQYVVAFDRVSFTASAADFVTQHVDANGQLTGALEVIATGHEQTRPVLASTRRSTFAAWRHVNICSAVGGGNESARLIEPNGAPFVLSQGEFEQQHPAVASAPGATLVVWTEVSDVRHLRMSLLPGGAAADLPGTRDGQDWAAVGTDGTSFLVAFVDLPDVVTNCIGAISVATVDANGHVGKVTRIADDAIAARPAIAWNGSEYAVIWQTRQATQLVGMRVGRDGTPLDTVPHPISEMFFGDHYTTFGMQHPAIAWTGRHYLVSWNFTKSSYIPLFPDPPPILERRTRLLTRDLTPEAGEVRFATPNAFGSAMAWNGSEALLLWRNSDDGGLWGTRLTADGYLLGERRIDDLGYVYAPPSLAWNGREWLATFSTRLFRIAPDLTLVASEDLGADVGVTMVAAVGEATTVVYDRRDTDLTGLRVFVRGSVPARRRIAP